jgi:hypothetical protein
VIDAFGADEFRLSLNPAEGPLISAGVKNSVGDILIHQGSKIIKNIRIME